MPQEITPKSRGLELDRGIIISPTIDPNSFIVDKVIAFSPGKSIIEYDGKKYELTDGTLSWRNNNPGNLKYGEFAIKQGAVGEGHNNMAVFKTYQAGKKAQRELLFGQNSKYATMNVMDAIKRYAPAYDNNDPKEYANYIVSKAKINKTSILGKLTTEQKDAVVKAMFEMEGYKVGKIREVK